MSAMRKLALIVEKTAARASEVLHQVRVGLPLIAQCNPLAAA
jgi:hypothetical protein